MTRLVFPGRGSYGLSSGGVLTTSAASLLLDAYPNAAFAYSFRKLRTAYAGSAVRIRASGDNAESDFGFVGNNFDSAGVASFLTTHGGSGFITTWYDQSGNGNNVTNATAGAQPAYAAAAFNGLPCLQFIRANDTRLQAANVPTAGSNVVSIFTVITSDSGNGDFPRTCGLLSNGQSLEYDNAYSVLPVIHNGGSLQLYCAHNNLNSGVISISASTPLRASAIWTASTFNNRINNSPGPSPQTSSLNLGGPTNNLCWLTMGGRVDGANSAWQGYHAEVVGYLADQTSNAGGIDSNQSVYWGF